MAGIGLLIGGAIANAVAFTGSNYLFGLLGGGSEERKRHDEAVEKLQKATAEWNKKRAERLDFVNERLREQGLAEQDRRDVDAAMSLYAQVTGKQIELPHKPQLSDFYVPSEAQRDRELAFVVLAIAGVGYAVYKLV